jgi:hypothetical protein
MQKGHGSGHAPFAWLEEMRNYCGETLIMFIRAGPLITNCTAIAVSIRPIISIMIRIPVSPMRLRTRSAEASMPDRSWRGKAEHGEWVEQEQIELNATNENSVSEVKNEWMRAASNGRYIRSCTVSSH